MHLPFKTGQEGNRRDGNLQQRDVQRRTKTPHGLAILIGSRLSPFKAMIQVIHQDEVSQATITIRVGGVQITNVYFPPSMNTEQWTSVFQAVPEAPSDEIVHVFMGDWNVRLGDQTGDSASNHRAGRFTQLVQSRNLTLIPFTKETPTFLDKCSRSSTPDFGLVSARHLSKCSAVAILGRDDRVIDHFPIMLDVDCAHSPFTSPVVHEGEDSVLS